MRVLFRSSLAALALIAFSADMAGAATTTDQLVALARAGLDDDVLIALIQTDGSVFQLTADDILELHRQGLSSRVILAMQQTARPLLPDCCLPPVQREARILHAPGAPEASAPSARPFGASVHQTIVQSVETPLALSESVYPVAVPVAVPVYVHPTPSKPSSPVYWGWGGQRRPDSWDDGSPTPRPSREVPDKNKPDSTRPDNTKKAR